jgi:hypothetical protein
MTGMPYRAHVALTARLLSSPSAVFISPKCTKVAIMALPLSMAHARLKGALPETCVLGDLLRRLSERGGYSELMTRRSSAQRLRPLAWFQLLVAIETTGAPSRTKIKRMATVDSTELTFRYARAGWRGLEPLGAFSRKARRKKERGPLGGNPRGRAATPFLRPRMAGQLRHHTRLPKRRRSSKERDFRATTRQNHRQPDAAAGCAMDHFPGRKEVCPLARPRGSEFDPGPRSQSILKVRGGR